MKIKQNTKVEGRGNNLKLKAQSLKREFISRFQLLIIYINFMQKTKTINPVVDFGFLFSLAAKIRRSHSQNSLRGKVGGMFSEIRSRKVGRGLRKVGMAGLMIFAVAAVWLVMPATREHRERSSRRMTANGAEAAI